MFGLGVRYLNGWAMAAADGAKKERAEWPPHPDRIFMAIAAAWFETDEDPAEKTVLEWLQQLPAPGICATDAETRRDIKGRFPVTSYVPVNDSTLSRKVPSTYEASKLKAAGLALLPEHRSRQPRKFPVAIPHDPVVHLVWEEAVPEKLQGPLSDLCRKVVSIGHSASFVQMWPTDSPPPPNLVPVDGVAVHRLRVFGPGKLAYLKARCARDEVVRYRDAVHAEGSLKDAKQKVVQRRKEACKGLKSDAKKEAEAPFKEELAAIDQEMAENRAVLDAFGQRVPNTMRPEPGLWQGYGRPPREESPEIAGSLFDSNLIVMNLSGKRPGLHSTLKLAEAARGALLSNISGPIPEWISGHGPGGARSEKPHLAMFPLAFVGREHADGRIMGLAFALPRQVDKTEAGMLLEPLLRDPYGAPQSVKLFKGKWLECEITVETRETPPWSLRTDLWTAPSRLWASVTPVVLDRHFDGKDKWDKAAETVKDSCERIGLPRPASVLLHPVSLWQGAPHSREFPPIRRKSDSGRMHHCHAVVHFSEPVAGPVVVGAGRYRGYGLMRPVGQSQYEKESAP